VRLFPITFGTATSLPLIAMRIKMKNTISRNTTAAAKINVTLNIEDNKESFVLAIATIFEHLPPKYIADFDPVAVHKIFSFHP